MSIDKIADVGYFSCTNQEQIMQMKFVPITPAVLEKIERQRQGPIPPEITELKEQIEKQTQLGEKMYVLTGSMHPDLIKGVVNMKLRLDGLYAKWLEEG